MFFNAFKVSLTNTYPAVEEKKMTGHLIKVENSAALFYFVFLFFLER